MVVRIYLSHLHATLNGLKSSNIVTNPANRPDVLERVFKIKLDLLLEDLTNNHILGKVIGGTHFVTRQIIYLLISLV